MASKMELRRLARAMWSTWELRRVETDHPMRPTLGPNEFWLERCWLNNRYSVQHSIYVCDGAWGEVDHLWIRRHDGEPSRSWADLQRIKDELLGVDRVALEVFPAAAALVDSANMYHLWSPPAGFALPFKLHKAPVP